jgi:hypothetical protein
VAVQIYIPAHSAQGSFPHPATHPPQHFLMFAFLAEVLIYISVMTKDLEHYLHVFISLYISLEKCSFAHLLIGLVVLSVFKFLSSLRILDINQLSNE